MNPEAEQALHITRIRQHLRTASAFVWDKPGFPKTHHPNVDRLSSHILIGADNSSLRMHPALKPSLLTEGREQRLNTLREQEPGKVTHYNFITRNITFGTNTIGLPDLELRRLVYRQAGLDLLNRESTIHPSEYTDIQRKKVTTILQQALDPPDAITMDQTDIVKSGFREYIRADGLYVAEVSHRKCITIDQMYPTAFTIITDQIMRRGGFIDYFDSSASDGQLQPAPKEDYPYFAQVLFLALQCVDWRYLLDALKSGDIHQSIGILNKHVNTPDIGEGIFLQLLNAIRGDEQNLADLSNTVRRREAESN